MAKNFWLVKQEPESYSWATFMKDGGTAWTGVRNFQARNNLRAMRQGELVFYYHSVTEKQVIGIARVGREAYPDPTATVSVFSGSLIHDRLLPAGRGSQSYLTSAFQMSLPLPV